ncbi:MAG: CDP-alcohol phosphatidyltransferase family protein [Burkholderiales bacterium]
MLDRLAIAALKPSLDRAARLLVRAGIGADVVTWAGFAIGVSAAAAITQQQFGAGLALLLASRVADGLDGAVARQTRPTDRGAFLDIALDFLFYASIPLAFAIADPAANALPAAVLLAAFIGTGSSFLAYAVMAERCQLASKAFPAKGIFYLGGLTEATETISCFVLMCLWPAYFATFAYGFAVLCGVTIVTRLSAGWRSLT